MMSVLMMIAAVGVGVMAGVYFTFSLVVMKALAQLPALQGALAMNRINTVIVRTLFLPLFFGSTVLMAALAVLQLFNWQAGNSLLVLIASLLYVIGMFVVTAAGNVPLNNRLQDSEGNDEQLTHTWAIYLGDWTRLNHIRTVCCTVSCALLLMAMN